MSKSNIINFSHYFIKKRILEEGKVYQNEIVGECFECEGTGLSKELNLLHSLFDILDLLFEQLQMVPMLIITPLVFLGGTFYSISMLPPFWQTISLFNPVVYLVSAFRWCFFGTADVPIMVSLLAVFGFILLCFAAIMWIFRTGWRLRS